MLKFFLVLSSVLLITSALADQACEEFKKEIPLYYKKGKIEVPLDWDNPNGEKIEIFYYGNISSKKITPIVFFNGGPSSDSHVSSSQFQINSNTVNAPFLFIDQRGTGCSTHYPEINSLSDVEKLKYFGSRSIVKDAEAIRQKLLGTKKWKIYGHSYGGLIAHRYLELFPESILSLHIYGNSLVLNWNEFYKERLLSQKRIIQDYFKIYPKDMELLKNIKSKISDIDCFSNEKIKICGPAIFDSFSLLLGFRTSWENLHQVLWYLVDKDQNLIKGRLNAFVNMSVLDPFSNQSVATAAIAKMEMMNIDSKDTDDQCTEAIKLLELDGHNLNDWPLNECRLSTSVQFFNNSEFEAQVKAFNYKDPIKMDVIKDNLMKNAKLKFYLYSGKLDAYVPHATFNFEVNFLEGRVHYTNFDSYGHDGYMIESKIWENLF